MGCTQSKIENEEAVMRCKERKLFMKEAVSARNAFAAAHSAYTMSLKNTGAALSDYAHGEVQNPQNIVLNNHVSQALPLPPSAAPPLPIDPLVPPPPPPPNMSEPFPPIQRATSLPAINLSDRKEKQSRESNAVAAATIMEEDDGEEGVESSQENLITRKRSSGRNRATAGGDYQSEAVEKSRATHPHDSAWDYFFPQMENVPGPTLEVKEEKEVIEQKVFDGMPKRVEEEEKVAAEVEPPAMEEEKRKVVEAEVEAPPPPPPPLESGVGGRSLKKAKAVVGGAGGMVEKSGGKGGMNLLQVFVELDDHFLKASESAHEVSKMLEATRLHYHSNFADNRGNSQLVVLGLIWK